MSVTIEVPATLANLGSGYDALGLAVTLANRFSLEPAETWLCEGVEVHPAEHLVFYTMMRAAERFGGTISPLGLRCEERVPRSRGMGSSATARVAGLLAYEVFAGVSVSVEHRLAFLSLEEGHPDNAWAALLGGLVICADRATRVQMDGRWSLAVCCPDREVSTPLARAALPATVPHEDAVYNARNSALLMMGLISGDLDAVREGVRDRLHQPFRMPLIGPVAQCFEAARALGAAPFIGGSGSTLAAFVFDGDALPVAEALAAPFASVGIGTTVRSLRPDGVGATVADEG